MHRRLALVAALAVTTAACSGPPTTEREQADKALAAARAAGAGTYASAELAAAESALSTYDAAVSQRDYKQAFRLAIEARDGAYAAARRAAEQKAARRSQAERLITSVETLMRAATMKLAGQSGPRPAPAVAARLRATLKTATSAVQKARSLVDAEDYAGVTSALEPIAASLQQDLEAGGTAAGRRGR